MYNIGHDIYYLDYQSKESDSIKYEFACQTRIKNVQKVSSYFVIELPKQINPNDQTIQDQNYETQKFQSSFIACIFYSNFENFNEYLKQTLYESITTSIYFQNQQYLEAFESCLSMLQNSFQNSELNSYMFLCQQKMQKSLLYNLQQQLVSVNAVLKLENDIYISKSLKNYDKIENMLYIQKQGKGNQSVTQLNQSTDFINYSDMCFKLKENIIQPDDILILTDSLTLPFKKIFSKNIQSQYPLDPKNVRFGNFMHILKIQIK
ncbi:hypothetical protein ABPG74_009984 [Tetrahymena malaccensis]